MDLRSIAGKAFKGKTQKTGIQVFRYLLVSGASFAVDFSVLWILTEFAGFHYLVSAAISYLSGLAFNYFLSILWVFHSSKLKSKTAEVLIFVLIGVAGLGLNELILWVWTGLLGLHYLVGRGVSAVIGYTWKYVARKWLLFR